MEHVLAFKCTVCGEEYEPEGIMYTCPNHEDPMEGILDVVYDYDVIHDNFAGAVDGDIPDMWKYRPFLPIEDDAEPITLNEGGTDLFDAPTLSEELGVEVQVKDDSRNPTAISTLPGSRGDLGRSTRHSTVPTETKYSTTPNYDRIYGDRFDGVEDGDG